MKKEGSIIKRRKMHNRMPGRLLAIALAAVLGLSGIAPVSNVQAEGVQEAQQSAKDTRMLDSEFETAQDLTMEGSEVSLEEEQSAYFRFVPQTDGIYVFSTDGDYDTYGQLYSGEGESLAWGGEDGNFSISYYLKADAVYYLLAHQYNYESASFTLNVEQRQPEGLEVFGINSMTVTYGESAILEVLAVSDVGEITYQWYKGVTSEDGEIEEAMESTYELPADNTEKNYYCYVTDGSNEQWVGFDLHIDTGLEVSSDVYDEEGEPVTDVWVTYGETTELKVSAEGGVGELTYQWYKGSWADPDGLIEGANESSYEVEGNSDCSTEYCCEASDGVCTATITFWIRLDTGLSVSSAIYDEDGDSTTDVRVPYGETTELKVSAEGGAGELTYQWYKGDEILDDNLIEGANGSSYEVEGDKNCRGAYYCEVSDGICTAAITFWIMLDTGLKVSSDVYDEDGYPTTDVQVPYEGITELKVKAEGGAGELTYQWYKIDEEDSYCPIEGANGSSYEVEGNRECGTEYWCDVTDGIVKKRVWFTITLDTGLKVRSDIYDEDGDPVTNVRVLYGGTTELKVKAEGGAGELTYQWYKSDDSLIEGANGSSYEVQGNRDCADEYYCEVTDGVVTRSVWFYVTIDTGLKVSSAMGEEIVSGRRKVAVKYKEKITLSVTASGGTGTFSYQWYKNGSVIEGAAANTCEITGNGDEDDNYYCCEVSDGIAIEEMEFIVTVDTGLIVSSSTGEDHYGQGGSSEYRKVYMKLGDTVSLEVTASGGVDGNGLTYEWYARGNIIEGQTSNRYVLSGNKECKDVYRCEVSDGVVTRTVMFYIDLNTGLKAVSGTGTDTNESQTASSTRNVLVEYQKKVTLEVTASSPIGEVSYEWYKDHSDETIEGAAGNSFEVSGIAGSEGTYICRVSDGVASRDVLFYVKVDTGLKVSSSTGTDWGGKDGNSDTRDVTAKYGKKNPLEVTANGGIGKLTYRWFKEIHSYEKVMIEGANTNRYELLGEANAPIWYYCVVTDGVASRTVKFRITLDNGLKAVSDVGTDKNGNAGSSGERNVTIKKGGAVVLKVAAQKGEDGSNLTYQWYQYHMEGMNEIKNAVGNSYTLQSSAVTEEPYIYSCIVDDGITNKEVVFYITIEDETSAVSIENCVISLSPASAVYTGAAIKPQVTVKDGTKTLAEGTDYTLSYKDNINVGNAAEVTVTGKGNYTGTVTKTFRITAKTLANATVILTSSNYYYNGKACEPGVTVNLDGKTLKAGEDYGVSYSNNTNIGAALVTITGKNNYTGNATKSFSITVKKGSAYTVGAYKYKITNGSEVSFAGLKSKKTTKVNVPNTVKIGGKNFKVTSIDAKALRKTSVTGVTVGNNVKTIGNSAFEGCSKLTKVTIGTGVTKIGSSTFKSCKKLGSITIKSAKLKTIGKNALKGIKSNAKVKVAAKKLKDYKKLFKGKGQGKKVKITK